MRVCLVLAIQCTLPVERGAPDYLFYLTPLAYRHFGSYTPDKPLNWHMPQPLENQKVAVLHPY